MTQAEPNNGTWRRLRALDPGWALGALCLILHLTFNGGYGVFRDELYFIVCGLHPAFGYVDQPPLAPLTAALSYTLFGLSPWALRLAPALAMSATVVLSARLAREFGGGGFAQLLAGLGTLAAPVLLVDGVLLTTDFLQPLTWLACSWCLVRLVATRDQRWWLAFGAVVGVSAQSKYLILIYVVALAPGMLATPLRRSLSQPWIYAGAALGLAILAPNLIWQASHGWPFWEVARAGATGKNLAYSAWGLLGQIALFLGPASAPLWIAGLIGLATTREPPEQRAFPLAAALLFAWLYLTHGKAYYLTPFAPTAFAAGGAAVERWTRQLRGGVWIRAFVAVAVTLGGLVVLPLSLPMLSPDRLAAYQSALGLAPSSSATERSRIGRLPQYFADMFGWPEMAAQVNAVYLSLPDEERAEAVFLGLNYGEAAAVELYGVAPVIGVHNAFYEWGTRGFDGSTVITIADPNWKIARAFKSVTVAGRTDSPWAMPMENGASILILRQPKIPLDQLWPQLKHYD